MLFGWFFWWVDTLILLESVGVWAWKYELYHAISMRALIIGRILRSPQREKVDLKTQQFCATIERSRESFRCPVKYPDIVRDLPKASHHHDNRWQYLHAFSGFFSWVCQDSHTLIKGVGPEAPANLLDECWCHHDFPQTLSRLGETHQPCSARMPGHCQTICYMLFQALWPGIWRSAAVQKMAYMIRISEGVRFYPEKMKDMNFGAATTRRYKRQATATNSPLCGQHHNPFGCA